MVISLGPLQDRPRRHLRGGSRLSASASNLITAGSEIAAGRIALFTPANVATDRHLSLLLSLTVNRERQSGLSTCCHASPAFTGHPCSMQLGLSSRPKASDHPFSLQSSSVVKVRARLIGGPVGADLASKSPSQVCRRGDLNSHGVTPTTP